MQACCNIENGDVEPITVNTGRAGQTVEIRICRNSDDFFLDWADDTFKVVGAVGTLDQPLTAKDAVNAPGIYELASVNHPIGLDTSLLGMNPAIDDTLLVIVNVTAGPAFATTKIPPGEVKVLCLIDAVVDRKTVHSRMNAMARGKVTLSGAASKPSQIATYYEEDDATVSYATDNKGDVRDPVP